MKKENIFAGIICIIIALLLVLGQFELMPGLSARKVVLSLCLVPILAKGLISRNFYLVFLPIAAGIVIYDTPLGLGDISGFAIFAAAFFLSLGLTRLFPKKPKVKKPTIIEGEYTDSSSFDNDSVVNIDNSLGASVQYVNSRTLQTVNIHCSYGGLRVYFHNAAPMTNEIVANLDIKSSGVELFLPRSWAIQNNLVSTASGINLQNYNPGASTGVVLRLEGNVTASGINIHFN